MGHAAHDSKLMTVERKAVRSVVIVSSRQGVSTLAIIKFVTYSLPGKIIFSVLFYRNSSSPAPLIEPQSAWSGRLGRRTGGLDLDIRRGPLKRCHFIFTITMANGDRFKQFFHFWIPR